MDNKDVAACLEQKRKEIFATWEARVRDTLPVARPIDSLALTNSLPELYDGLIKTLTAPDPKKYFEGVEKEIGRKHGEERSRLKGYDLNHVIEEYQILRHVIFEVVRKSGTLSSESADAILDAITIGIRNATSEFVKIRTGLLTQAQLRAQNALTAKSVFLTNMSHEIRTPLAAMLGYTELLADAPSKSERDEYIKVINRNGKALVKLIDEVLDLSKVEAGRLEVEHIAFALDELMDEVLGIFQEPIKAKNVTLAIIFDPKTPLVVESDPTRLRQILINIIGNAVKFTPSGSIKVNVEPVVLATGINGLRFTITDTGIGITAEEALTLFVPFSQADGSTTRKFGGTGLGLVLSRHIARALGGDVELKSCEKGQGCTFVVTVEAKAAKKPNKIAQPNSATKIDNIKILLVEDSPDNQDFIKRVLEKRGAVVDTADNGKEGVQKAISGAYDVVLMDMQMPVLDGYAATKNLRALGFKKPILALTAHALAEERLKTKDAGCNAHITKPIDTNLLVEAINELMV